MALIKCPECGHDVSNTAFTCPNCGYTLKTQPGKAIFRIAEKWGFQTQTIRRTCDIIDLDTNKVIASAKMGEMTTISVKSLMKVRLKLHGYFGSPELTLHPGKTVYVNVSIKGTGTIECQVSDENESDDNKTKVENKGGCYVATCVYGSYDCPQVWTLRRFRDYKLAKTRRGRLFIKMYYAISPTLVKLFGKTNWFKKIWRGKLDRMVAKYKAEGFEDTPYNDIDWK